MAAARPSAKFTVEREYTVRRPNFFLFKSVEYLDPKKLARGTHEIELGRFEGGCCDCPVMGTVKNGVLTGVVVPKCEKATEIPAAMKKGMAAARRALSSVDTVKWENIPIGEVASSRSARNRLIIIITGLDDCYEICVGTRGGTKICFMCCPDLGWCIGPSDPQPF